ncbi:hypothetical protein GCM10017620_24540 [Brevundimonas intermedia]|uniref:Uncharacterized protein n=1 Tax=Brevundimonas intermedia TaxID=74315 RepID=A0ABQ5TCI9_9CAUL|nr:hypothetical protein [Brevundimonas intermedia]GLK49481.1 hypothetical protein GCM10017620_24540 [Brevundimonas intermedia]
MPAQSHIDAIGAALIDVEEKAKAAKAAARDVQKAVRHLHQLLDKAQTAYSASTPSNVVLFSGGTDKPDPNKPVED